MEVCGAAASEEEKETEPTGTTERPVRSLRYAERDVEKAEGDEGKGTGASSSKRWYLEGASRHRPRAKHGKQKKSKAVQMWKACPDHERGDAP